MLKNIYKNKNRQQVRFDPQAIFGWALIEVPDTWELLLLLT